MVAGIAALWRDVVYFTRLAVLTMLSVCVLFGDEKIRSSCFFLLYGLA